MLKYYYIKIIRTTLVRFSILKYKNIEDYYNSLQMRLHHNYYFGRNEANITKWLEKDFLKILDDKQIRHVDYILTDKYLENLK